jgi:hypothetical protein
VREILFEPFHFIATKEPSIAQLLPHRQYHISFALGHCYYRTLANDKFSYIGRTFKKIHWARNQKCIFSTSGCQRRANIKTNVSFAMGQLTIAGRV